MKSQQPKALTAYESLTIEGLDMRTLRIGLRILEELALECCVIESKMVKEKFGLARKIRV